MAEDEVKTDINKVLDALRPATEVPLASKLPKGVTPDKYADMKNLTDLITIVTGKGEATPAAPVTTISPKA